MLIRWSLHGYLTLNTSLSPTWASYTIKFSTLLSQGGWFVFIPKLCAQEDVIHETRHPCTRLQCRDWWDNYKVTWCLRGQTRRKICQYKESRSNLFNLDNRKWRTQNAVVTVDFFTARNYDLKLVETRTVHGVHWEIDMPTSWAHFFLWALRVSGRFLMFTATKASERAGVLGPTTKTKDFEIV